MNQQVEPGLTIRTAVAADLPALQHVYRAASLSNPGDEPNLLAHPEYLAFAGDGIADGRTLVAVTGPPGGEQVVGLAGLAADQEGARHDRVHGHRQIRTPREHH
jgi:hypothetical protein